MAQEIHPAARCRSIVCFVALIVVAHGDVRVLGTEVAGGPVIFHVKPP